MVTDFSVNFKTKMFTYISHWGKGLSKVPHFVSIFMAICIYMNILNRHIPVT